MSGMLASAVVKQAGVKLGLAMVKLAGVKLGSAMGDKIMMQWNFKKDLEYMRNTLVTMEAALEDAEKQSIKNKEVALWLKRLKNAAYDISDMLDEFEANSKQDSGKVRGMLSHLPFGQKNITADKMKTMRVELGKIEEQHNRFKFTPSTTPSIDQQHYDERETTSDVNESDIIGRKGEKQAILDLLSARDNKDETMILPIHGLGGMGKTTLAGLVFNDNKFKEYDHRVWVYVSQVFDLKKIGSSIISQLLKERSQQNAHTMQMINRCLDDLLLDKKILIVLDDIWEEKDRELDKLKSMLRVGKEHSMIDVIVTTRKEDIAEKICTDKPYKLEPLKEDTCWDIIKKYSHFESKTNKEQFEQIGREIAKKCGGMPLAAQALGYTLKWKDLRGWSAVNNSDIWNESSEDENFPPNTVLPSLKLSYKIMPPHFRLCFAYCAIFPKGHNIVKDDLIHQWIALDLIKPSTRDGEEYIKQLSGMSFLQRSKLSLISQQQAVFTMHDLVHDLARSVMADELLVSDSNKGSNSCQHKYCRYALLTNYSGPTKLSAICPAQVRALHFLDCSELELRNDAFSFAKCLRVLDLSGCPLSKLPKCVTQLPRLQYLNLHGSRGISALPKSIGKIDRLIHLDLSSCTMLVELPESLGNLKSLVHLELSDCSRVVAMPQSFCGLTKLQYLNLSNCSSLEKLPEAIGSLTELQHLNLSGCCKIGVLPESFRKLHNLVHLDLSGCRMLVELPESLGDLKSLLHLELSDCSRVVAMPKSFCSLTKLQYLNLSNCSNLEKLPEAIGSLTELQHLNLSGCCKIGVLPESFWKLHNLVHLDLSSCCGVKGIPGDLGDLTKLQHLNLFSSLHLISALTNLEHLDLSRNGYLHYLPASLGNLKRLHTLDISGCRRLKALPESLGNLKRLHTLDVSGCQSLATIPESIGAIHTLKFLLVADCSFLLTKDMKYYRLKNSVSLPVFTVHVNDVNTCSNLHQLGDINPNELEICCLENVMSMEEARGIQLLEKQNLSKLTFDWTLGPDRLYLDDKDVLGELVPPKDLKELGLRGYNGACFPTWLMGISHHLPNLVKIKFEDLPRCNRLPPLGQLPNLDELHLEGLHSITKVDRDFCGGRGAFRRLSNFTLRRMEELEAWNTTYSGEDGEEEFMFPKLDKLHIQDCPKLRLTPRPPIFRSWIIWNSNKVISSWSEGDHVSHSPSDTRGTALKVCFSGVPVGEWRLLHHLPTLQELMIYHCGILTSLPENMRHLSSLQSLGLEDCNGISALPEWLGHLTSLEILDINKCRSIESLPQCIQQITKLKKLTISWNHRLKRWCESEDNKMKLAHIKDISYVDCASAPYSVSLQMSSDVNTCSNLHQLEDVNLNELQISCLQDVRSLEEARKIKLLHRQSLSKLTLEWTSDVDRILEDEDVLGELVPPPSLQYLMLDGYRSTSFPTWLLGISQYLPNLVEIQLENLPRCKNLPPLGQLPNLEELHLRRLHNITKIDGDFCGGKGAFLRLLNFRLEDMERLEAWNTTYGGEDGMEEFMFPELDDLRIADCPKLRLTPRPPIFRFWTIDKSDEVISSWSEGHHVSHSPSDMLRVRSSKVPVAEWRLLHHLPTLQRLFILDCDKLTSLPENMQHLASLQSLTLSGCDASLQSLELDISQYLPNLVEITIENMPGCNNLPPLGQLPNLKSLRLQSLHSITKIDGDFCGGKGAFLRLSEFYISGMEKLEEWNTTYCGEDGMEEFMFPKLHTLEIVNCPKLRLTPRPPIFCSWIIQNSDEVISSWSEGNHVNHSPSNSSSTRLMVWSSKVPVGEWRLLHHLPTLQKLIILDCDKLTSLPENMQHLASLQSLVLSDCGGISALPEWLGHLTSLEILKITECPSIKSLPQCIQQITKLKELTIRGNPGLKWWCGSDESKMKLAHIKHIFFPSMRVAGGGTMWH